MSTLFTPLKTNGIKLSTESGKNERSLHFERVIPLSFNNGCIGDGDCLGGCLDIHSVTRMRKPIQVVEINDTLVVLANDGTLWT